MTQPAGNICVLGARNSTCAVSGLTYADVTSSDSTSSRPSCSETKKNNMNQQKNNYYVLVHQNAQQILALQFKKIK